MKSVNKGLLFVSFFLYFGLLVWGISFKCNLYVPISECLYVLPKIPFVDRLLIGIPDNIEQLQNIFVSRDFYLNMLIFLPLGIYLPLISEKVRLLSGTVIAFILSFGFEIAQTISCVGGFTIADLLANTLGFVVGYIVLKLIVVRLPDSLIDKINIVIIVIATPIFIYAAYNTAINIEMYNPANYK